MRDYELMVVLDPNLDDAAIEALNTRIQGMVTRKGWDGTVWGGNQRVSVSEAIAINTLHGA